MFSRLVRPAKERLRGPYRALEKSLQKQFRGFDAAGLLAALRALGISPGDALFVHSASREFAGFRGTIAGIVRTLQEAVTPAGVLLMPTIPFTGSALEYAKRAPVFDPRRTPSQMGMISEVFRRFPQVERSFHPTHPVAVWGARSAWWIQPPPAGLPDTPCGRGTVFERLPDEGAKILFAGVPFDCLTLFHYAEELLEPKMPFSPFTRERFSFACRLDSQIVESAPMRLYEPAVSRRRDLSLLAAELRRSGCWKQTRVGTLSLILVEARDALRTLAGMADRGVFCYRRE